MKLHGKITWHELSTPDVARARAFYGELFGWHFEAIDGHTNVLHQGRAIAGMWAIPADHAAKVTPHWGAYVSVPDVDAALAAPTTAGGAVVAGPHEVPGLGRLAVLDDATQANIVALAGSLDDPADRVPGPGEFCWDALVTSDVEAAKAFYEAVFGWQIAAMDGIPGSLLCKRPDGPSVASIVAMPGVPPHWAPYVAVAELAPARERTLALGGKVVREELVVPGVGTLAVIQDPTGAHLRLFQGV